MSLNISHYGVPKMYQLPPKKIQVVACVEHVQPNDQFEVSALFYAMERLHQDLARYLPSMTLESQKCETPTNIRMESRIDELLKDLVRHKSIFYDKVYNEEDPQVWKQFGKAFLTITLEIYNTIKWQVYYAAGDKLGDISYTTNKKKAAITPQPLRNGRARCAISEVEDVESAFDVHHLYKRFLWGTSAESMLIKMHREFHKMIHTLTDNPEEENRINLRIQNQHDVQLRSALVAIDEKIQHNTRRYVENIFRMETYMQDQKAFYKSAHSGKEQKAYARFIINHADKAEQMLKNYVCEMASQLIESIPFFLHNMRLVNSYEHARYKANILNTAKARFAIALKKIDELRPGDVELNTIVESGVCYQEVDDVVNSVYSSIKKAKESVSHFPERHIARKDLIFETMDVVPKAYPHAAPKVFRMLKEDIEQLRVVCDDLYYNIPDKKEHEEVLSSHKGLSGDTAVNKKKQPFMQYLEIDFILSEIESLCMEEGVRVALPLHVVKKNKKKKKRAL